MSGSVDVMNASYSSTRRRQADDVEVDPAEEGLVVADAGGGDPQLLELGGDQRVDVVGLGLARVLELEPLGQHEELRADGVGLEPGHDERLAAVAGGDQAVGRDRGRDLVVRQEDGQAGDVAVGAVGVAGPDGHLLRRALAVEHARLGIDVDADDRGELAHVVVEAPCLDPLVERPVHSLSVSNRLPPVCCTAPIDLLEERAVGGDGQVDPSADHLAGQAEVVALGVEAEERDAEAVLAARGTVAAAGVAAGPHEDRHHVEPEAERRAASVAWATFTGIVTRLAAERHGQRRLAVASG